ncbi:NAD-dependent epimerase/dehydratase family protein, partial [Patescibacteria group bacterium]|nr:NAD-dependent epimerase/dehydratase family protein [Patescibacteria group bacterium]
MENNLEKSNILVTGGTGLVGSHLIEALLPHSPHKIVSTIRTWDPFSYFFMKGLDKQVILAQADIRDYHRLVDIVCKHEIDVIFHLAAQPIVDSAYSFPQQTISSNINGTTNILEAARISPKIKAVVVASSDKAYGQSDELPYKEDTKLEGLHPYDASKSATDLLARSYFKTYNLPVTVTRFGNIFGPGDDNFNRIIPGLIKALIHNETFDIRSDGKMIREYLFVKDVAAGYIKLAEQIDKAQGEAFNFGSSHVFSVLEIVEKVIEAYGNKVEINILNEAKNE